MRQGETSAATLRRPSGSTIRTISTIVISTAGVSSVALIAGVVLTVLPAHAHAQEVVRAADVRVGTEAERYLRALTVLAPVFGESASSDGSTPSTGAVASWTIRPLDGARVIRSLAPLRGPWSLDTTPRTDGFTLHGAEADASFNSGLPSYLSDGPAWSGRGANLRASGSILFDRGPLHVRLAPVAWAAQNASFELLPTDGPFAWSDAAVGRGLDLPQRLGDGSTARLDPGESTIELRGRYARLALTSAATQLGPGTDHALVMQGDAGGIPRLELGTSHGLRTRFGTFAGQVAWGRTPHTAWAPDRRTGALFTSYLIGTWRPAFVERLEVGMVRLTHRDWERITARELFVPFGSIYSAKWVGGSYDTENDNQIASVFANLRVPEAGLEFFAEFGKNDRSRDWRDQAMELEHNSAWLVGAQRVWRGAEGRLWSLNVTGVSGSIAPITRFRGQAFFYEHGQMTQGHTLRGQLLGTPLLQREGGAEVRLDRYDATGRLGLILRTRSLPNERAEFVAPENVRQEWMAVLEMMRWTAAGSWSARLGGVADLGYSPVSGDAFSLHVGLGWARR